MAEAALSLLASLDGVTHVHDTGVDVSELLEAEETGGVGRVVEDVRRGGVDGDGARLGRVDRLLSVGMSATTGLVTGREAGLPGVELEGLEVLVLGHDCGSGGVGGGNKVERKMLNGMAGWGYNGGVGGESSVDRGRWRAGCWLGARRAASWAD